MDNKIYDKIRQTIKENYKFIIAFIVLLIVLNLELPFYIEAPGGIIDINDRVEIKEKYESEGSFNLAYVTEVKATIPTMIYAYLNKEWDILKKEEVIYDNETMADAEYRNHLLLNESTNNAIIVGYSYANKEIKITNEHLYIIYVDDEADTDLKIGDEILEVDGIAISNKEQLDDIVVLKNTGDNIYMTVKRAGKEVSCYGKLKSIGARNVIGVVLSKTSDIETDPEIELMFKKSESGPSGGFMLALSIYDSLIEEDITKGKKIVGTGTIDLNGNIGQIGGVEYKIKGAVKEKADIFLVPSGNNYLEAKAVIEKNNYNIQLIEVETFTQALEKLKNI